MVGQCLPRGSRLISSSVSSPAIVPRMSCSSATLVDRGGEELRRPRRGAQDHEITAEASAEISSSATGRRIRSSLADSPSGARGVRKPPSLGTA
ncbi:hypothetical protein SALBM217S_09913 [Streptomyces griseoloalbus]